MEEAGRMGMVLPPPPNSHSHPPPQETRASSLRIGTRTRPVSCDVRCGSWQVVYCVRREGGQGCVPTGSALGATLAWWLKQDRGHALLPQIDLSVPSVLPVCPFRLCAPANHLIIFIPSWPYTSRPAF